MSTLWSLEFFCGVWSQKSEHKEISITISQVQPVGVGPGADGVQMWKHCGQDDVIFASSVQFESANLQ
jgi:hypothetical protein